MIRALRCAASGTSAVGALARAKAAHASVAADASKIHRREGVRLAQGGEVRMRALMRALYTAGRRSIIAASIPRPSRAASAALPEDTAMNATAHVSLGGDGIAVAPQHAASSRARLPRRSWR
jgi:hypothetical protein